MIPGLLLILAEAFNTFSADQIEAYLEQGDYDKALYLTRINSGLYSPNQIPILEKLIEQDPEYLHLLVNVCERAYGRGSDETIKSLVRLSQHAVRSYTDSIALLQAMARLDRGADTESGEIDLLLAKAEIAGELLRLHYNAPLIDYRSTINSDVFSSEDQREMELARAYMIAKRSIEDAEALIHRHPEKISRFNEVVSRINSIPTN